MPSYMQNLKGTIRKVKGADPLPVLDPTEQKNSQFRRSAFIALRIGCSKRQHAERLVQQVHAFRAADVAEAGKLLMDTAEVKKEGGNESS